MHTTGPSADSRIQSALADPPVRDLPNRKPTVDPDNPCNLGVDQKPPVNIVNAVRECPCWHSSCILCFCVFKSRAQCVQPILQGRRGHEVSMFSHHGSIRGNPGSVGHHYGGCKPCNKYNPERLACYTLRIVLPLQLSSCEAVKAR